MRARFESLQRTVSSVAMRCVENPGRSITNVCAEGVMGVMRAQPNHPAAPSKAIKKSQTILRTVGTV